MRMRSCKGQAFFIWRMVLVDLLKSTTCLSEKGRKETDMTNEATKTNEVVNGQQRIIAGQPRVATGNMRNANGQPRVATGNLRDTSGQPRTAATNKQASDKKQLSVQDLILVAVLLAAGAVLKLTVGSLLASFGMKPNFIIAAYCLAIIIIRPNIAQSVIIGLIAGLVCQIPMLNATPLLNIPSEILGALACGLLIRVPLNLGGKLDINPLVTTFLSTCVSGFTFAALSVYINVVSVGGDFAVAMAAYVAIVLGTALFNCIFVQILAVPLKKVLKK